MKVALNVRREEGWFDMKVGNSYVAEYCDGMYIYTAIEDTPELAIDELKKGLQERKVFIKGGSNGKRI